MPITLDNEHQRIGLLAELAAILMMHPDRMLAFRTHTTKAA